MQTEQLCVCSCHFGGLCGGCDCKKQQLLNYIADMNIKINKMQSNFREFEKQIVNPIHKRIDSIIESITEFYQKNDSKILELERITNENSKILRQTRLAPFKCPICYGNGTRFNDLNCICRVCEGKGIVWG